MAMTKVVFVDSQGNSHHLEASHDLSLMRVAVTHGVPGIVGECGGACVCATCHVHVDQPWADQLPPRSSAEADTLEFLTGAQSTSRLACQLMAYPALDGLTVRISEHQGF